MSLLNIDQVSKTFGKVTALEDIKLEVHSKEFIVVLGPSGCGKTTLLRLIAGLERPLKGKIELLGKPVLGPGKDRGYLFQEPRLFPWLTVEKNLMLAGSREAAASLLQAMGLTDFARSYPHELSGGMAKRVALARALMGEPELLLLDEPLVNLDIPTRTRLQQTIRQVWQEGQTMVMVTHDVDEALLLATRLVIMESSPGRIIKEIEIGTSYPRSLQDKRYEGLKKTVINIWKGVVA